MIKLRRAAAVVATALAFAVGALAIPASAATPNAASGTQTTIHEAAVAHDDSATFTAPRVGALKSQAVSPNFSACSINAFGNYGEYICGTQPLILSDILGGEAYVIGTNWAIWETTATNSGWFSLGGVAEHTTANAVNVWSYSPNFTIWTWGTDGQQWCDMTRSFAWSGWYRCTG
jgi:hypothetical protein